MSGIYSIGAMNQLADALENDGKFSPDDITKLKQSNSLLKSIKDVLYGLAQIIYQEHLIDCDADPYTPDGLEVMEHKKGGLWRWNPNIPLYLSKKQKKGVIDGHRLRKELANKPVLNANVLDFLYTHQELIPEEWKGKSVFFWGTIYRSSDGSLYVRYLHWDGSGWSRSYDWLGGDFEADYPAALAS